MGWDWGWWCYNNAILESLSILNCPKLKALPNFLETTPLQDLTYRCSNFQLDDDHNINQIERTSSLSHRMH
jgi:hypothetical protein